MTSELIKNQEALNTISKHLFSMDKRSTTVINDEDVCLYNGPDDNHCAIGVLLVGIPLDKHENSRSITDLRIERDDVKVKLEGINVGLLSQLQGAHDRESHWDQSGFKAFDYIQHIASVWNLTLPERK